MSKDARRKNRERGEKQGHRREKGRTPRKWKILERSGKWRSSKRPGTRGGQYTGNEE